MFDDSVRARDDSYSSKLIFDPSSSPPDTVQPKVKRSRITFSKKAKIAELNQQIAQSEQEQGVLKKLIQKQLLKRFKDNIMQKAYILPTYLTEIQKLILNDKNLLSVSNQAQFRWYNLMDTINIEVFQPSNKILILWDFISIVFTIFNLWYTAFQICFAEINQYTHLIFPSLTIIYTIIDIMLNLNRSQIKQGEIINDRREILFIYYNTHLYYEIFQILTWIVFIYQPESYIFNELMAFIQMYLFIRKIYKKYTNYCESITFEGHMQEVFDLVTLITSIYLFAHLVACIWHYVGVNSSFTGTSWLMSKGIEDETIWIRYNYSFYWAVVTMVTVGYGDITAQNYLEFITASIIMFVSSYVFAYSLNTIGILLKNINDSKQAYKNQLKLITSYMIKNSVSVEIQNRVRNYLKCFNDQEIQNQDEINLILNHLPKSLQHDLMNDMSTKLVSQFKLLIKKFSFKTLLEYSENIEQIKYAPGEIIVHQNQPGENFLFQIVEGKINIVEIGSNKILQSLQSGDSIGAYEFFTGEQFQYSVISVDFTSVYRIQRTSFMKFISQRPNDHEKFHHVKDNLIQNDALNIIDLTCIFCLKQNHLVNKCPFISYRPDIESILKKQLFYVEKNRNRNYVRRKEKSINPLENAQNIISSIQLFREQNQQQESLNQSNHLTANQNLRDYRQKQSIIDNEASQLPSMNSIKQVQSPNQQQVSCIYIQAFLRAGTLRAKTRSIVKSSVNVDESSKSFIPSSVVIKEDENDIQSDKLFINLDNKIKNNFIDIQFKFDKLRIYSHYQLHNNFELISRSINKKKARGTLAENIELIEFAGKYSFIYNVKLKASQLREFFLNDTEQVDDSIRRMS